MLVRDQHLYKSPDIVVLISNATDVLFWSPDSKVNFSGNTELNCIKVVSVSNQEKAPHPGCVSTSFIKF